MAEPPFDVQQAHRWFAVEFNNGTWDLLESENRTPEDDARMTDLAHAASLHWHEVGTPLNDQRAEYLLAKVYLALKQSELAFCHAARGLELSESNGDEQTSFDRACTYEAISRAHASQGDSEQAANYKQLALDAADKMEDTDDRKVFDDLFQGGNWTEA